MPLKCSPMLPRWSSLTSLVSVVLGPASLVETGAVVQERRQQASAAVLGVEWRTLKEVWLWTDVSVFYFGAGREGAAL